MRCDVLGELVSTFVAFCLLEFFVVVAVLYDPCYVFVGGRGCDGVELMSILLSCVVLCVPFTVLLVQVHGTCILRIYIFFIFCPGH